MMTREKQSSDPDLNSGRQNQVVYCEVMSPPTRSFQSPSSSLCLSSFPTLEKLFKGPYNKTCSCFCSNLSSNDKEFQLKEANENKLPPNEEGELTRIREELERQTQTTIDYERTILSCSNFLRELKHSLEFLVDQNEASGVVDIFEVRNILQRVSQKAVEMASILPDFHFSFQNETTKNINLLETAQRNNYLPVQTMKKILNYSDVINTQQTTNGNTGVPPIRKNLNFKFENIPLTHLSSYVADNNEHNKVNEKDNCLSFEHESKYLDSPNLENYQDSTPRRFYTFGNSNNFDLTKNPSLNDESFPTARLGKTKSCSEEMEKINQLEDELKKALETISDLQGEKKEKENVIYQLQIQKEELMHKLQTQSSEAETDKKTSDIHGPRFTESSEDLDKFLDFNDSTRSSKEAFKFGNTSYFGLSSLTKYLSHNTQPQFKQNDGKNYEVANNSLLRRYENKILDTIQKLEDIQNICELVSLVNNNIEIPKEEHSSPVWKAFKMEFVRKVDTVLLKGRNAGTEIESNRRELIKLIEYEESLIKKDNKRNYLNIVSQESSDETEIQQLQEENQELNKLIDALMKEVSSLKSEVNEKIQEDQILQFSEQSGGSFERESVGRRKSQFKERLTINTTNSRSSSKAQEKVPLKSLVMDNLDLYHMLHAQASALEGLLT